MSRFLVCVLAVIPIALRAQEPHLDLNNPDIAAIAQITNDIAHHLADGNVDGLLDYYSPAAIYTAEGEAPVDRNAGKAVAARWRKVLGSHPAGIILHIEEIEVSGDIAYDRVSYTVTTTQRQASSAIPGQGVAGRFKLTSHSLEILRKEDGVWKYYRVMTTTSLGDN